MIVICSLCGQEMEIDTASGVAYVTEADGSIHHAEECPEVAIEGESGDLE
jgi:hypothetical protein